MSELYSTQTAEELLDEMKANVRDDVDKREGSIVHDMLAPSAQRWELANFVLDAILDLSFIDTAEGVYVDKRAEEQGITRKPAELAKGFVTVTGTPGVEIPEGFLFMTESGLEFTTDDIATIGEDGTAVIACTSVDGDYDYNVEAGAIKAYEVTDLEITGATNAEPFSGAIPQETDDELKARYLLKVRNPVSSGNIYHYQTWALEVSGIASAKVFPLWEGPGTVKVVVAGVNGRAPSAEILQNAQEYIELQRPIGASVTVIGIEELPLSISAVLELREGVQVTDVQAAIELSLSEYLTHAIEEEIVRINRVGDAIRAVDGVLDATNLQINGGTTNITLTGDQSAYISEVVLT